MKLVSIFFKTSESIFAIYRKDTDILEKTDQVYLNIFLQHRRDMKALLATEGGLSPPKEEYGFLLIKHLQGLPQR